MLILGDGLLGSELVKQSGLDYISRKKDNFDINNISLLIDKRLPNIIINCIANTDTYSKEKDNHWNVNCVFLDNLIDYCNLNKIKLIHVSTDYIYAGSVSNANETDVPVHCNNWYGYTKLVGDALVQLRAHEHLIIRCTHKPIPFPYDSAWINQIGNFDYVNVIASLIIELIKTGVTGVYNVGTDTKTMYELAMRTIPSVGKSFVPEYVPRDQSMNVMKMKSVITNI